MFSAALIVGSSFGLNIASFRQRKPSATYVESVALLTYGQQVEELEQLCAAVSLHRLAMPVELQLLQEELARMKCLQRLGIQQHDGGYLSSPSPNNPMADLRVLEVAETVAEKVAEFIVAEAAAAEVVARATARAVEAEAEAVSAALVAAEAAVVAVAAVAAEVRAEAKAEPALPNLMRAAAEVAAAAQASAAMTGEAPATVAPSGAVEYRLQVERAYGRDPRLAPAWIRENPKMLRELAQLSRTQPSPTYASASPAVGTMLTLADFEAVSRRPPLGACAQHAHAACVRACVAWRACLPARLPTCLPGCLA